MEATQRVVSSEEVAKYEDMVEINARRFAAHRKLTGRGAEFEDLKQWGLIQVWQDLGNYVYPSNLSVQNRMRDYVRVCARQEGLIKTPAGEVIPIEVVSFDDDLHQPVGLDGLVDLDGSPF